MKHSHKHDHVPSVGVQPSPVRFEYSNRMATTVFIAGTFNEWQPTAKAMHHTGDGHWLKDTVLNPGTYEYCLVVDGRWIPDPAANETVPNPFGGMNSVLRVASTPEAAHLVDLEHSPSKTENK